MKAISLWEPWATLMKLGLKRYETRSWPLPPNLIGKRVAIHAAKHHSKEIDEIMKKEPFKSALKGVELTPGHILCTLEFIHCHKTEDIIKQNISSDEIAFGNYGPNRFAFESQSLKVLKTPIPFKGMQGWFNVPDDLEGK
jgi:activating signal cointegrator 1